jgi:signal recognition particle subunit SEC65
MMDAPGHEEPFSMKPNGNYDAAYNRRVMLRNRLLKKYAVSHPAAKNIRGAARKLLLDQLEADYLRPRVWNWTFDYRSAGNVSWVSDRPAFKLYIAAVKLRIVQLRAERQHDTARMLTRHIQSLIDVAPRAASCYYPREWREISRALRPHGSNPRPGRSMELYNIYQRIIRTHKEGETL